MIELDVEELVGKVTGTAELVVVVMEKGTGETDGDGESTRAILFGLLASIKL